MFRKDNEYDLRTPSSVSSGIQLELITPINFTKMKGDFEIPNSTRHGDDNYTATGYGQQKPSGCSGALIFGSGTKMLKSGGEYGSNGLKGKIYSFNSSFNSTNKVIFENHQECAYSAEESVAVILNNLYIQ